MTQLTSSPNSHSGDKPADQVSRRKLFAGAGTLGVVAAAASLLPSAGPVLAPNVPANAPANAAPSKGGGYHLSEHVKRYYQTTQV
jgi:hypothetical protein